MIQYKSWDEKEQIREKGACEMCLSLLLDYWKREGWGGSGQGWHSFDIERDAYKQEFSLGTDFHKAHIRFQVRVEIFNTTLIISRLTLISDFIGNWI